MIKKAALILFTFSALVGAHLLYTAAFAMIVERLAVQGVDPQSFPESELDSTLKSQQLALEHFGPDHFTSRRVKLAYYDKSRGSFMYAQDKKFSDGGKVMEISPFAMISESKDGKSHKTVTSEKAILKLNQPFMQFGRSKGPQRIISAELIGNVQIRDDKGTTENPADDLLIGPMTRVRYEEQTMQVTTDSEIVIQDQDMIIVGSQMTLQLRRKTAVVAGADPKAAPQGDGGGMGTFDAETATLHKNVHIKIKNVTPGGILPGQSKPDARGQTPLDLTCAGVMRIDLPQSPPSVPGGPSNHQGPPEPTFCRFEKNVRVVRGTTNPDQLNCNMLYLTLSPDPKKPAAVGVVAAASVPPTPGLDPVKVGPEPKVAASGSPMMQLKLRTALAQGNDVWLQSESQGMTARCVELKYEKRLDQGLPDLTYLNGGTNKQLVVNKVDKFLDGPKAGSIKAVMRLVAADASILDPGAGGINQIVARGPGSTEERPNWSESVTRVAWFEDRLTMQTSREGFKITPGTPPDPAAPAQPLHRLITLMGQSKLVDHTSRSTLEARDRIVAEFESDPKLAAQSGGDGPSRIKWAKAYKDVHLTTPGRTLTGNHTAQVTFVLPDPTVAPSQTPASPAPGPATTLATSVATPGPVVALGGPEAALPEAQPDAPPPPVEGAVDARANRIFATVVLGQGNSKGDLREAKLRGGVMVHQEPVPGEWSGKNMVSEALDIYSQGKGLMKFVVGATDPEATNPEARTKLAAGSDPKSDAPRSRLASRSISAQPMALAQIEFDGKIITSEKVITFDQQANFASANGKGSLVQLADAGLLDDKGLAADRAKTKGKPHVKAREPLRISWNDEMKFFGRSRDRQNREVAKVELRGTSRVMQAADGRRVFQYGVEAIKTDAAIYCDTMDVYMDKTIDFSKANRMSAVAKSVSDVAPPDPTTRTPAEPDAEISMIEAWGVNSDKDSEVPPYPGVNVTNQKFFEGTQILEDKYRIHHTHLIYDKRTGDFEGSGAGTVFLYKGKLPKGTERAGAATKPLNPKTVDPTSHTMQLTKIQFTELVKGRFGVSRSGADVESRTGEFLGQVQTANAVVRDSRFDIDFDQLNKISDAVFLTSDILRVRSEPRPGPPKVPDHQFLYAEGNAAARTVDSLIQGDRITYDSATELIYVYGDAGKEVSLVQQKSPTQTPIRGHGSAAYYNKRTRQGDIVDPQTFQIFDPGTGKRPKATYPDLGGSGPKFPVLPPQRPKLPRPGRNSVERNGFVGGR